MLTINQLSHSRWFAIHTGNPYAGIRCLFKLPVNDAIRTGAAEMDILHQSPPTSATKLHLAIRMIGHVMACLATHEVPPN